MDTTAKDLRFHSKELLESVEHTSMSVKDEGQLFGIWKNNDAVEDVNEYILTLRGNRRNRS